MKDLSLQTMKRERDKKYVSAYPFASLWHWFVEVAWFGNPLICHTAIPTVSIEETVSEPLLVRVVVFVVLGPAPSPATIDAVGL